MEKAIQTSIDQLMMTYIHHLAQKQGVGLNKLYGLYIKPTKRATTVPAKPTKSSYSKKTKSLVNQSIIARLTTHIPPLQVKEKNGYFYHPETRFVLQQDKKRFVVVGTWGGSEKEDGSLEVIPLTVSEIQQCKDLSLQYTLPLNLFSKIEQGNKKRVLETEMTDLYSRLSGAQTVDDEPESEEESSQGEED